MNVIELRPGGDPLLSVAFDALAMRNMELAESLQATESLCASYEQRLNRFYMDRAMLVAGGFVVGAITAWAMDGRLWVGLDRVLRAVGL